MSVISKLIEISASLSESLSIVKKQLPVTHMLDPTVYAKRSHVAYLNHAQQGIQGLMLGMNPGPWGMAQTGVPFGEVASVRDFLGIEAPVEKPKGEHPKRPVLGFDCPRSEVSGRRLWGWVEEKFGTPQSFFARFFVWNWCPLVFLEEGGRNCTPDKIPVAMRAHIEPACDEALRAVVKVLQPESIIAVGTFAERRAKGAIDLPVHRILHPSPASPAANRGWAAQVDQQLRDAGLEISALT